MIDTDRRFYELRNESLKVQLKQLEGDMATTRQQYVAAYVRHNAFKSKVNNEVRRLVGELNLGDIDLTQWELK